MMVRSSSSRRHPPSPLHNLLLTLLPLLSLLVKSTILTSLVESAPLYDQIDTLPTYGKPPTRQYSGFLNATDGCDVDVNGGICMLHYWFIEAEDDDETKPVVLWLNGGPGSSGIIGLLTENGPLLLNATSNGLHQNPYSWNKIANLLIIEAPIGVGYSYCGNQLTNPPTLCINTDKYTASATRAAIVDFYTRKFPERTPYGLFLTGESYAGVYIPTLAKELLDDEGARKVGVQLKGVAVGDPCTDAVAQADSMDPLWYGHKYGLVTEAEFDVLWNTCGARYPPFVVADGYGYSGVGSTNVLHKLLTQERVRLDLEHAGQGSTAAHRSLLKTKLGTILHQHLFRNDGTTPGPTFLSSDPRCIMAHRKFLLSTSHGLSQDWADQWLNDYSLFSPGGLTSEMDGMATYMSRDDVRSALHVQDSPVPSWPNPQGLDYTSEYAACNAGYKEGTLSMIDFYRAIAPRLDVTVVYNGDTDPCVSWEGTAVAIERVGFDQVDGGGYRPWFYNHTAVDLDVLVEKAALFGPDLGMVATGAQFGGEVVNYEHNLMFVTVHGSGHMVPQFRPQAALHMLTKVLERQEFSPLMMSNQTLQEMSDDEFEDALSAWTQTAKAAPYVPDL